MRVSLYTQELIAQDNPLLLSFLVLLWKFGSGALFGCGELGNMVWCMSLAYFAHDWVWDGKR